MPRPIWSGSITFGLVNIPVKLFSTVKRHRLPFHQLRKSDGCRIRLKRICATDGHEVSEGDIIKGYEISPEHYVTISAEEMEGFQPTAARSIEIQDFVALTEIDPIYYEHSYYLIPDKGAEKAYMLLLEAMKQSHKIAVASFILRNKQYLAAIRAIEHSFILSTMYFHDEILSQTLFQSEINYEPDKREINMALQLIESLSNDFTPEKYQDIYHMKMLEFIESKASGQQIVAPNPQTPQMGKVVDLMSALEASLAEIKKKSAAAPKRRKKVRA